MSRHHYPLPRASNLDPLVKALLQVIDKGTKADYIICQEAGYAKDTLWRWRQGFKVYIPAAGAIAEVVGYELVLVRKTNAD